jgi:ubiquinone/menaquinone biosynthesis C-methylase UbiE
LSFHYFTDTEYEQSFFEFGGMRSKIASRMHDLTSREEMTILDLLSGHGLLSAEMAKKFPKSRIVGLGLKNDVESWEKVRRSDRYDSKIWTHFHYIQANTVNIPLKGSTCDMIVNFLGLEDLHMTSGLTGLEKMVEEVERIAKRDALIQVSMVEYGDSPEESVAQEVWEEIGLNAIFLERAEYLELFEKVGLYLVDEFTLLMNKKMSANQAKDELKFACTEAPKIFMLFGVKAMTFDELWDKFGERIENHGMAYWPKVHVIILSKE